MGQAPGTNSNDEKFEEELARNKRSDKWMFLGCFFISAAVVALVWRLSSPGMDLDRVEALVKLGAMGLLFLALVIGIFLSRRRATKEKESLLGFDFDLARLRSDPALVERLRSQVASVGLLRVTVGEKSYHSMHVSFLLLHNGETVDVDRSLDTMRIEEGARWLAKRVSVPLVDGRYGAPLTYQPDELEDGTCSQTAADASESEWFTDDAVVSDLSGETAGEGEGSLLPFRTLSKSDLEGGGEE